MSRGPLPSRWIRWRRQRYQLLVSGGLGSSLSWRVAAAEAKWRRKVSEIIGPDAALTAELTPIKRNGQFGLALSGSLRGLSDEQATALEALSQQKPPNA